MSAGLHWSVAKAVEEVGGHFQLEGMSDGFPLDIVMEGQRIAIEVRQVTVSGAEGGIICAQLKTVLHSVMALWAMLVGFIFVAVLF